MIFITLGSQKFQFNRLLKEIDRLVEEEIITEDIFAQIGYSDYKPKNFKYKEFLDRSEFEDKVNNCAIVITHGGTGAIVGALKKNKKVIAIPRLKDFKEHVDNHQIQIVQQFDNLRFIIGVYEIKKIKHALKNIENFKIKTYTSNTHRIIESIDEFLQR